MENIAKFLLAQSGALSRSFWNGSGVLDERVLPCQKGETDFACLVGAKRYRVPMLACCPTTPYLWAEAPLPSIVYETHKLRARANSALPGVVIYISIYDLVVRTIRLHFIFDRSRGLIPAGEMLFSSSVRRSFSRNLQGDRYGRPDRILLLVIFAINQ